MTETSKLLQVLMRELATRPEEKDYSYPPGWQTVEMIRVELNLAHTRNASSRAKDLFKRGVLERLPVQLKCETGQCHRTYVYKPLIPFATIKEASENLHVHEGDVVPKQFVRIVDYALELKTSAVTIRSRVQRSNIRPTYFKTCRGISGLHKNAFYLRTDLDKLSR